MTSQAQLIGTCLTAFDHQGWCIIPELGWTDLTDLAHISDISTTLSEGEFRKYVEIPPEVEDAIVGHRLVFWKTPVSLYILYDGRLDRHYFFV